jgi:hypothetical protein
MLYLYNVIKTQKHTIMKTTTKKHIRENTRRIEGIQPLFPSRHFSYWYQRDSNTAFELRWSDIVIKHDDTDNICIWIGDAASKEQFVDVVYDYLKLKNTQS